MTKLWRMFVLAALLTAAAPVHAENHYRDNTPDSARGKPVNHMTLNLALLQAAEKGWDDDIARYLEQGANVAARNRFGSTPLLLAAGNGHRKAVRVLLDAGSDINHRNLAGSTPLIRAAEGGHRRIAKMLIEAGAAVDAVNNKGVSALTAAAFSGDDDVVEKLLENGANAGFVDRTGKSAMVYAAAKGFSDSVRLLLAAGVAPDARYGNDLTALMWAAGHANDVPVGDGVATVSVLLDHDATVDLQDNRGRTALMIAAQMGHAEVVERLIAAGARTGLKDKDGQTAGDLAAGAERDGIVALLAAGPRQ